MALLHSGSHFLTVSGVNGRFSIALWVSGFVLVGSAAAFVNSAVLSDGSAGTQLRGADGVVTVMSVVDAATFEVEPGDVAGSYVVGDAGQVQFSTEGGELSVTSVTPSDGWRVASIEATSATRTEIVFESGAQRLRLTATLVGGVIETSLTDLGDSSSATTVAGSTTATTVSGPPNGSVPSTTSMPRSTTTDDSTDDSTDDTDDTDVDDSTDDTEVDDDATTDPKDDD